MEVMIIRPAPMYIGGAFFGYLFVAHPEYFGGQAKRYKMQLKLIFKNN